MLVLLVLDRHHLFSVVYKTVRLNDAWFAFTVVSGEQVSSVDT